MWFDGIRQPNTVYIASVSRGKDSTAMLEAIKLMDWPLDYIVSVDIWATQDIPAELPPMVAFKEEWDAKCFKRFGVPVARLCAMQRERERERESPTSQCSIPSSVTESTPTAFTDSHIKLELGAKSSNMKKLTYEDVFYRKVSPERERERERDSIATRQKQRWKLPPVRIPDAFRELVPVRPQAFSTFGFPGVGTPWCTSELKRTVLSKASLRERVLGVRTGSRETSSTGFSEMPANDGRKINIIHYIGIAADEPERIAKHMPKKDKILPLVQIGWEESLCGLIAQYMDMLSPTYDSATRDGCWFCHNQSVGQLRLLRKNYPDLWALLMKWDSDSPITFHPDGHTVHDFDQRFQAEDDGFIDADKPFRWAMLEHLQYRLF